MREFKMPTTSAEWAAVEVERQDDALWSEWCKSTEGTDAPKLAAASRLLEFERRVGALAEWLATDGPMRRTMDGHEREARRILEDAK